MANMYFNKKFEVCTIDNGPEYLYIDDVEDFLRECGDDWISDNVDKPGVYQWNDYNEVWDLANLAIDEKVRKIIRQDFPRQELPCQGGNIFIGWNILITLDTGETIKTNSEPISMNEVQEAINILLKPSFFGKRIKKFEIVAE